jgi:hypothetical protein
MVQRFQEDSEIAHNENFEQAALMWPTSIWSKRLHHQNKHKKGSKRIFCEPQWAAPRPTLNGVNEERLKIANLIQNRQVHTIVRHLAVCHCKTTTPAHFCQFENPLSRLTRSMKWFQRSRQVVVNQEYPKSTLKIKNHKVPTQLWIELRSPGSYLESTTYLNPTKTRPYHLLAPQDTSHSWILKQRFWNP